MLEDYRNSPRGRSAGLDPELLLEDLAPFVQDPSLTLVGSDDAEENREAI